MPEKRNPFKIFDPQGSGFDMERALLSGMKPAGPEAGENQGHFGSVAPTTFVEQLRLGLPTNSFIILKGRNHISFQKAVEAEKARGFKIIERDGRFFSVPDATRPQ